MRHTIFRAGWLLIILIAVSLSIGIYFFKAAEAEMKQSSALPKTVTELVGTEQDTRKSTERLKQKIDILNSVYDRR